jgi:hypothetical protein
MDSELTVRVKQNFFRWKRIKELEGSINTAGRILSDYKRTVGWGEDHPRYIWMYQRQQEAQKELDELLGGEKK